MSAASVVLSFDEIVVLSQEKRRYILEWTDELGTDGSREAFALAVLKRAGGLMLCVPTGFIPEEILEVGNQGAPGLIGPSLRISVPGVIQEQGQPTETSIGGDLQVLLVDTDASVCMQMREAEEIEEIAKPFAEDDPYAYPDPGVVVARALEWARSLTGDVQDLSEDWYSAAQEEMPNGPPLPEAQTQPRRRAQPGATSSGQPAERPKRPTTTSLQASLNMVLETLPELSNSMRSLADRQQSLEDQLLRSSGAKSLSQPLAAQVPVQASGGVSSMVKSLQPPPRVGLRPLLDVASSSAPQQLKELEKDREATPGQVPDIAQAMLAQSAAITSLVAHLAGSAQDPLAELQMPGTAGVRGSTGRARLQAELAQHKGLFFDAVLRSMSRRMAPTSVADRPAAELLADGISGTHYLERFGVWRLREAEGHWHSAVPGDAGDGGCR